MNIFLINCRLEAKHSKYDFTLYESAEIDLLF